MSFPLVLHDRTAYPYDRARGTTAWPRRQQTTEQPSEPNSEHDDAYDACKESPLVDTLVEGAVVLLIAALINMTFWGIVRFGVPNPLSLSTEVA